MSETDRQRVERIMAEACVAILREVLGEDGMAGVRTEAPLAALKADVAEKCRRVPAEGIARLAAFSDEQLRRAARDHFEADIRAAVAPMRPS